MSIARPAEVKSSDTATAAVSAAVSMGRFVPCCRMAIADRTASSGSSLALQPGEQSASILSFQPDLSKTIRRDGEPACLWTFQGNELPGYSEPFLASSSRVAPIKSSKSSCDFPVCSKKVVSRAILSFGLRYAKPDCSSALAALTRNGAAKARKNHLLRPGQAFDVVGQRSENMQRQSSLPCTYRELTFTGRPCRSLWHSVTPAGHSASGNSANSGFIATHGPDRRLDSTGNLDGPSRTLTQARVEWTFSLPHPPHHGQHLPRDRMAGMAH